MSATIKQRIIFDAAARELWRAAESGDADEIEGILSRGIDVNARNEYGTTALMRAARQGHTRAVEMLLDYGADPNVARNDKFTALALAAFFGHTETLQILIDHGARTEVVTRCGTSPRMWATARTFNDAARCLEQKPAPVRVANPPLATVHVMPAPEPPRPAAPVEPLVVRTLKEPPEIWDLVHEAPRSFNPGSNFVARIASMKLSHAIGMCAVLLLLVGGVWAWVLKGPRARSLPSNPPPVQTTAAVKIKTPQAGGVPNETTVVTPQPVPEQSPVANSVNDHRVGVNKTYSPVRQVKSRATPNAEVVQSAPATEVPAVATPQFESRKPPAPVAKSSPATLSPQLITPPKSATKGKVIQWP